MDDFDVCPKCHRHVKRSDASCPFCASSMPRRAALAGVLAVGLGMTLAACGGDTNGGGTSATGTSTSGSSGFGGMTAAYGPPPQDGGQGGAGGGILPVYGPPPPDGGQGGAGGGADAAYGPPPFDGGQGGGFMGAYGPPPFDAG